MFKNPSAAELNSSWAQFSTKDKEAAIATKNKLKEVGIAPEKVIVESESFKPRLQIKNTQAITNLKTGAIAGGVFGGLIGLFISLILTNFGVLGFAALKNFQAIHYLYPVLGAVVGAAGISLISGLSGITVPKPNLDIQEEKSDKIYLVRVQGTIEETNLAKKIMAEQNGLIKEPAKQ